jgi:hypothetical protein
VELPGHPVSGRLLLIGLGRTLDAYLLFNLGKLDFTFCPLPDPLTPLESLPISWSGPLVFLPRLAK